MSLSEGTLILTAEPTTTYKYDVAQLTQLVVKLAEPVTKYSATVLGGIFLSQQTYVSANYVLDGYFAGDELF